MPETPEQRLARMKPIVLATLLRIGRRIEEGFDGEIQLVVVQGGVKYVRWIQTETGDKIREELG